MWVSDQVARMMEQYFRESLGSRHPALTILRRLSAQAILLPTYHYLYLLSGEVDHLLKKLRDREIQIILLENDISPFEVATTRWRS